jgi:hypothetical protein
MESMQPQVDIEEVIAVDALQSVFITLSREAPDLLKKLVDEAKSLYPIQDGIWVAIEEVSSLSSEAVYKLGSSPLPNEKRFHKHGSFDYRWESRQCEIEVFLRFRHPTLDQYLNDAITCAGASGLAAVIAAVASGNVAAGYALFYPAWKACMLLRLSESIVNDFQVELFSNSRCGCWENHC